MQRQEIKSPLKAIRAFCIECCGNNTAEVKRCSSKCCVLNPFRLGHNPYRKIQLTDEQKAERAEQLRRIRNKDN